MSLPEVLLWNLLRKSPEGVHFRRQEGIGKYILDFYCAKPRIGFEIDGISHNMAIDLSVMGNAMLGCISKGSKSCGFLRWMS